MASTDFITLTNRLLRRLNEVEIDPSNWANTQGVQSMAKDAINSSVEAINNQQFEWPFNVATTTELLVKGQTTYDWPADFKVADFESFHIKKDDILGTNATTLEFISKDKWEKFLRDADEDAGTDGRGKPVYIFPARGYRWGVSPSPNEAFEVEYDYWRLYVRLIDATDTPTIPSQFDETIIQGALYHFYMFRDNTEQADRAKPLFDSMVGQMRTLLINKDDRISSTMISRSAMRSWYWPPVWVGDSGGPL